MNKCPVSRSIQRCHQLSRRTSSPLVEPKVTSSPQSTTGAPIEESLHTDPSTQPRNNSIRWCYTLIQLVKLVLFLGAATMSIYQTSTLLHTFIHQNTISQIAPTQNLTLKRPRLVACVNIIKVYLSKGYEHLTDHQIRTAATLGEDYGTLLFRNKTNILNITKGFPFVDQELALHEAANNFTTCSAVFGTCNELHHGWSDGGNNCCENSFGWLHPEGFCYAVYSKSPQVAIGKPSTAIYELTYPVTDYDVEYDIYLVDAAELLSRLHQPVVTVHPGVEVNVAIEMHVVSRLNTTKRKCSTNKQMINPHCEGRMSHRVTQDLCNCSEEVPIWWFNSTAIREGIFDDVTDQVRPCRLFENWMCPLKQTTKFHKLFDKYKMHCYSTKCLTADYHDKTTVSELAPYFRSYSDQPGNQKNAKQSSLVYVFYSSMTIMKVYEVYPYSWTTVLSSLGGVWGLWLGWSLFQAANYLLGFLANFYAKLQ